MDWAKKVTGNDLERAQPLGLILTPPQPNLIATQNLAQYLESDRDGYTLLWMKQSDDYCAPYKSKIIQVSRDTRLATSFTSIILNSLATILTPVNTVRGLAGAAAAVTGVGAAFQADMFNGQVGEVLTSAIETARRNQANQIRANLALPVAQYNIWAALRDVSDYHDMCSLNTALIQIRTSLQATAPDSGLSPPAKLGQTSGGLPAKAVAEIQLPATIVTSRPPSPRIVRQAAPLPTVDPNDPPEELSDADFDTIRKLLGLSSTQATSIKSTEFKDRVRSFQQCLHAANQNGVLTHKQAAIVLAGNATCLPSGTPPTVVNTPPPTPNIVLPGPQPVH
jgi:hypothetical protein